VDPAETNNDATNYWIFSQEGLRRIIRRTGWEVRDFITVGDTRNSDPARPRATSVRFASSRAGASSKDQRQDNS